MNTSRSTEENVNSTLQNSIEEIGPSLSPILIPKTITMETSEETEQSSIEAEQNSQNTQKLQAKIKVPSQEDVNLWIIHITTNRL